ncbi:hypothetical protein DMENIID0001_133930 [Sergentomyia squamirostris]
MNQSATKSADRRTPQPKQKITGQKSTSNTPEGKISTNTTTVAKESPKATSQSSPKTETVTKAVNPAPLPTEKKPEQQNGSQNGTEKQKHVENGKKTEEKDKVVVEEKKTTPKAPVEEAKKEEAKKEEKKQESNEKLAEKAKTTKKSEKKETEKNLQDAVGVKVFLEKVEVPVEKPVAVVPESSRPNKTPIKEATVTQSHARLSPIRKSDRLKHIVSTPGNLSTVSEKSNEVAQSPTVDQSSYGSLRHISGRRSFASRPVREYSFQSPHREFYRKLPDAYDDSMASVNATVGSEIHVDSFRTPVIVGSAKGRKRELVINDSDDDIHIVDKTPSSATKRTRLDFNALLGIMASPVTMLRNKFQRANIRSSTPNKSEYMEEANDENPDTAEKELEEEIKFQDKMKASDISKELELEKKVQDVDMNSSTEIQKRRACIVM